MTGQVTAKQFVHSYQQYAGLLEALDYRAVEQSILSRVADTARDTGLLSGLLAAHRNGTLDGELLDRRILERMEGLKEDLASMISSGALRLTGGSDAKARGTRNLADLIPRLSAEQRDRLADLVMLDGHRDMVERRHISVEEFQQLLKGFAGDQTIARKRLIEHMRAEFLKRGIDMSCETIQERFRPNPNVRTVPYCVKEIFRGLTDQYRTGLVPIEQLVGDEDPDAWLGRAQERLGFRSQAAMHKAIAEATGLSYDCIHKGLSGSRKAQRIQVQIKRCLDEWLAKAEQGESFGASDDHRGVPVEKMCELLAPLRERYLTKEDIYRAISKRTGVRTASIRRYFQNDGQLKFAPLTVYRVACELSTQSLRQVEAPARPARVRPRSARHARARAARPPAPSTAERPAVSTVEQAATPAQHRTVTRKAPTASIESLVLQAKRALALWQQDKQNMELERDYRDMRRMLIIELKARRSDAPRAAAHAGA